MKKIAPYERVGDGINAPAINPHKYPALYIRLIGAHDAIEDLARYLRDHGIVDASKLESNLEPVKGIPNLYRCNVCDICVTKDMPCNCEKV